ncbi:hypothetical protein PMAYCL1PPCAC_24958, partial [Pristionchus mayeri]
VLRMATSVEQIAAVCRSNIRASLTVTSKLLQSSEASAIQMLLARMNDVLGEIVETNFGASTNEHLYRLYAFIGEMQPALVDKYDNLALYYFARSLAVVLEETMRQKERGAECGKNEHGDEANEGYGREAYGSEKEHEETRERGSEEYGSDEKSTVVEKKEEDSGSVGSVVRAAAAGRTSFVHPSAAPAADERRLVGCEQWRRAMQRARPDKELDFSFLAVEGRITIFNVPSFVQEEELRFILLPFGPIVEFVFSSEKQFKGSGFALVKLESNSAADEAVAALDQCEVGGARIIVKRAMFVTKPRPLEQQPQTQPRRVPKEQKGKGSKNGRSVGSFTSFVHPSAAPAVGGLRLVGCEPWRRGMQRARPDKELDFSLDAVEGRIKISNFPSFVGEEELRRLLIPFGPLIEFLFSNEVQGNGFAHVKLESNWAADQAVTALNQCVVGGVRIKVKRAFVTTLRPLEQQPQTQPQRVPKEQMSCSEEEIAAAAGGEG